MFIINKIVVFIIMLLCALVDLYIKKVPIYPIVVGIIGGIFLQVINYNTDWVSILLGVGIGVIIYFFAYISKEKIGKGDGLILMLTGVYLGFSNNLKLLLGGLGLAFIYFFIVLCMGKINTRKTIPFVPFLFVSFVLFIL